MDRDRSPSDPSHAVARLLDTLRSAFDEATRDDPERRAIVERLFVDLDEYFPEAVVVPSSELSGQTSTGPSGQPSSRATMTSAGRKGRSVSRRPSRLPVCEDFERALSDIDRAARGGASETASAALVAGRASIDSVAAVARALLAIEPCLTWYRRIASETHGPVFHDGHANAFVIGPGGVVDGSGAAVGISLVAPNVRYPDHQHAPEELYLVLSPGRWRHGESDWFEPGIGGVVHNTPDIVHAMHSGAEPLLAIWCLLAER